LRLMVAGADSPQMAVRPRVFVEQKRSGRWSAVGRRAGAFIERDGAHPASTANDNTLAETRAAIGGIGSRGRRPTQ